MAKYTYLFKFLTIASLALVLVMSLRPAINAGSVPHMDKMVHLAAYAVLAGLFRLGWPNLWGGVIFLCLAIFGIGIEILQHVMALGRTGSIADTLANLAGAALALIFFHFFWTRH